MATSTLITILLLLVGTAVTVASVFGTFRMSRNTSAITGYRDAASSWEAKAKAQEVEIADLQARLDAANASIEALNQRVTMLSDIVTSRTLVEALAHSLEAHHATAMAKAEELSTEVRTLESVIRHMAGGTA